MLLNLIYIIIFSLITGYICAMFIKKEEYENKKNNNTRNKTDKNVKNKIEAKPNIIKNIFIISCNTILYCVLYIITYDQIDKVTNNIAFYSLIGFIVELLFITLLIYLGINDAINKRITNKCNLIFLILGIYKRIIKNIVENQSLYSLLITLLTTILIMLIIFIILYLIRKISKNKIGGGDVKFISLLPLYFDYVTIMYIMLIASILSSIYGLYLIIFKNKDSNYEIGYGLFLSIACIISTFVQLN